MHFFLVGKVVVQKGCVSYQTLSVIFCIHYYLLPVWIELCSRTLCTDF
jgi:hypothetical protein